MLTKRPLIIVQLLLIFQIFASDSDLCTTNFETLKSDLCTQLSTSSQYCSYLDNECKPWYKECTEYAPTSNFDSNTCLKITPSNSNKKCQVQTSSSTQTCIEVDKTCSDFTDEKCFYLNLGTDKRCVLINGKCEEHSNECTGLTQAKCASNIPKDFSKKCDWNGSSCTSQDRTCNEYKIYTESSGNSLSYCTQLKSSDSKICYLNENKCAEVYKNCDGISDATTCQNTKPFNSLNVIDTLNKCVWERNTCKKKLRLCSDYKKRESDNSNTCSLLSAENSTYKKCLYNLNEKACEEVYRTCAAYNSIVTDTNKRTEAECGSIISENWSFYEIGKKCALDSATKECKEVTKECKDFTDQLYCQTYSPEDDNKYCLFINDKCQEEYRYCEAYSSSISDNNRKKEECQSIIPKYSDGYKYKCIYSDLNSCEKKKIENCEEYEGTNEDYCNSITLTDSSKYKCIMKNNKCSTQFINCDAYDRQSNKDQATCESIILEKDYKKCVFNSKTKECYEDYKTCSEYTGNIAENCGAFRPSDYDSKVCIFENNKCVEKTNYVFKYCSDYEGENQSICESIQPFKSNLEIDYGSKCLYDKDKGCFQVSKQCTEAKNENECSSITPSNTDKYCVYINNSCKEQYKTCQSYQNSGNTLDKATCESIKIKGDNINKCVFTQGTNGARDTCQSTRKTCTDFNVDLMAQECANLYSDIDTKKCSFSNKVCSSVDITTCLELYNSHDADENICKAAKTSSSNLACEYSDSPIGCIEVNKKSEQSSPNINNAKEKYLNKILFVFGFFLF